MEKNGTGFQSGSGYPLFFSRIGNVIYVILTIQYDTFYPCIEVERKKSKTLQKRG